MAKSRKDIVRDLLKEANYYWYEKNEDIVNPLNPEGFDPVVDKIFKANALELEKLYAEIDESQREILLGLAQALVPEESLLPEPGYTIACVNSKADRIYTSPEDKYQIVGQSDTGEKIEYYFTPLLEHSFPRCELKAVLTHNLAIQIEKNKPKVVSESGGSNSTSEIWLGFDFGKVEPNDTLSFFLGNRIIDNFDKDHYLFHNAKWLLLGEKEVPLHTTQGVGGRSSADNSDLFSSLDISDTYEKRIFRRLDNCFLLVDIPLEINNYKSDVPPGFTERQLTEALQLKQPLCWIKIQCSLPIPDRYLFDNTLHPNCIPLVNRRLLSGQVVKNNYDRIIFPLPTTDLFLDIHKVEDARSKGEETSYHRVDFLNPGNQPGTYSLRGGSRVRRLNREDASKQIQRLLEVIQDEYSTFKEKGINRLREDFDVIEKAINRIRSQLSDYFREEISKATYFGIANFRPGVSRLYYHYWETQGDALKQLGDKVKLEVTSTDVKSADSYSVVPIRKGKGALTQEDYINQIKISLLSGGKILTRADVERYCRSRYGQFIKVVDIGRKLMAISEEGNLSRGVVVTVRALQNLTKKEVDVIKAELQNDLNINSAFFTPIKVEVEYAK